MRSKSPLALMEQLIMVLVFALAAALCLQVFVFSDQASAKNAAVDRAVSECQMVAETLKVYAGDWEQAAEHLNATAEENSLSYLFNDGCLLLAKESDSGSEGLGRADIFAYSPEQEELFRLSIAWQEVDSHG